MRYGADRFLGLIGRASSRPGSAVVRSGSGALGLAYVAAGRRDGYVENHMNAWDCLAGIALVREAGGYVSDFLSGRGTAQGQSDPRLRARRQGRAAARRRDRGAGAVTPSAVVLRHGDARAPKSLRSARRRASGASAGAICSGRAIPRSGTRSVRSSIPSSAGRATARASTGRQYALGLHGFARKHDFRIEARERRFRALRCCATTRRNARDLSLRVPARGRISPRRRLRSTWRSRSKTPATSPRPTPADCIPASIGLSPAARARARSCASRRTSAPKFP